MEWIPLSAYVLASAAHVVAKRGVGASMLACAGGLRSGRAALYPQWPLHKGGACVSGWPWVGAKQLGVDPSERIIASKCRACVCHVRQSGHAGLGAREACEPHSAPIAHSTGPVHNGGACVRGWSRWGAEQLGVDPSERIRASKCRACVCHVGQSGHAGLSAREACGAVVLSLHSVAQSTMMARVCVGGPGVAKSSLEWIRLSAYVPVSAAHVFAMSGSRGTQAWVRGRLAAGSCCLYTQ